MTMRRHDEISARLSEYAFGYLSPEERRDVDAHVRECTDCVQELDELMLVMEGLARAPEVAVPPPALKERVLARLAREPQDPPVVQGRSAQADVRTRGWSGAWLAAAAAVIVAVGGALWVSQDRERRMESELDRVAGEITELQGRLNDSAAQADMALSILTAGDMRRIELAGGDGTQPSSSTARAYWSPTRGLLVAADRLPVPPPGRVYQVWLIGGGAPVSAGLLGSPTSGRGMLIAPPPGGISAGPVTVAVTDEPPGGLPAPTGGKHLVGSL